MWFAAMTPYYHHPWLLHLVAKLLQGDWATLKLLAHNPFPDEPPRYVLAEWHRYRFTDWREKRKSGHWWKRTREAEYLTPLSLEDPNFRDVLQRQGWLEEPADAETVAEER